MTKPFFCSLVIFLLGSTIVSASGFERPDTLDSPAQPPPDTLRWYSMFSNLPGDWAQFSRSTFRAEHIPLMLGIAGMTGALIAIDEQTWRNSHRWYDSSHFVHQASDFFEYMGDGRPQFGLAGGFALYGFVFRDHRALVTSSELVEAILSCGAVVQLIKHVTGRQSPYVSTMPRGEWNIFPNQIDYHKHVPSYDAFPSGHIATALTTLTVIAENYPEWKWVRPIGYPIIALIGVRMANTGIHWYSDYPLGLALGYSFGMLVSHRSYAGGGGGAENGDSGQGLSLSPSFNARGPALEVALRF